MLMSQLVITWKTRQEPNDSYQNHLPDFKLESNLRMKNIFYFHFRGSYLVLDHDDILYYYNFPVRNETITVPEKYSICMKNVKSVSVAITHAVILTTKNEIYMMGENNHNICGQDGTHKMPIRYGADYFLFKEYDKVEVIAGRHHCFLVCDNILYGWGSLANIGQRNPSIDYTEDSPVKIEAFKTLGIKKIVTNAHTLLLTNDGSCYGWGYNSKTQVLPGTDSWIDNPTKISNKVYKDVTLDMNASYLFQMGGQLEYRSTHPFANRYVKVFPFQWMDFLQGLTHVRGFGLTKDLKLHLIADGMHDDDLIDYGEVFKLDLKSFELVKVEYWIKPKSIHVDGNEIQGFCFVFNRSSKPHFYMGFSRSTHFDLHFSYD